jgi:release factor family 10
MAPLDVEVQRFGQPVGTRWPPLLRELASLDVSPARLVSVFVDACGATPSLRPLAAALGHATSVLCIVVDSHAARAFSLPPEGADAVAWLDAEVPRRHSQGGWSQLKLQHWRFEEVHRHYEETAGIVAQWTGSPSPACSSGCGGRGSCSRSFAITGTRSSTRR